MLLKKGEKETILDDGVGLIRNVSVRLSCGIYMCLMHVSPRDVDEKHEWSEVKGFPTMFSLRQEGSKTVFTFFPIADEDYDIEVIYYPHAKRG